MGSLVCGLDVHKDSVYATVMSYSGQVVDHNWVSASSRPGRGVSEPLQLKCVAHTGSAGPNETIPEGTVGSDVVEISEDSNKALNRK